MKLHSKSEIISEKCFLRCGSQTFQHTPFFIYHSKITLSLFLNCVVEGQKSTAFSIQTHDLSYPQVHIKIVTPVSVLNTFLLLGLWMHELQLHFESSVRDVHHKYFPWMHMIYMHILPLRSVSLLNLKGSWGIVPGNKHFISIHPFK